MLDVIIIGGGLAGLCNAIELAKAGASVAVIEKNQYPFHKVCGEYISNETLPFLESLGLDPFELGAVALTEFSTSTPKGQTLSMTLDLGGFGISRYTLDHALYEIATKQGVKFYLKTKVIDLQPCQEGFQLTTDQAGILSARICIGAYGKRANIDQRLQRNFLKQRSPYVGVKYHIRTHAHPAHQIALHNFKDGYCGISQIEDGQFCLCYLTTRENLRKSGDIPTMEKNILSKNPFLAQLFQEAEFLYERPLVINEITFTPKPLIEQGVLMCGDTAGMIAPLCGNGMAIAIHSAKLLSGLLIEHLAGTLNRSELEMHYTQQWRAMFAQRLWAGRSIQRWFGHPQLTEILVSMGKTIPLVAKFLMSKTHGKPF